MLNVIRFCCIICAVIVLHLANASAATMDYLGAWKASITYAQGKVVVHNDKLYYSLKSSRSAANIGKSPGTNPAWWAVLGSAGDIVIDANGKLVGELKGRDLWITTASGVIRLFDVGRYDYDVESEFFYASTDCSGNAFMDASSLVKEGMILNASGTNAFDINGKTLLSGRLYYPSSPFTLMTPGSMRVFERNGSDGGFCTDLTQDPYAPVNYPMGLAAYVDVDWTAPLQVRGVQ